MNHALKEDNDSKLAHKEGKDHVIDLKEHTYKTIPKISTLQSSTRLNIQQMRENNDEALNYAKENSITETIEELYKLSQNIE